MAKPTSEQQFCKSDVITFCFVSFLEQYTKRNRVLRLAGWLAGRPAEDEIRVKYEIYRMK